MYSLKVEDQSTVSKRRTEIIPSHIPGPWFISSLYVEARKFPRRPMQKRGWGRAKVQKDKE
jgi:hypothetical protein